jgi:acetylornithine deacetylase
MVIDLLKSLVRFPSVSREEKAIADFVEGYVRDAGLRVARRGDNVYCWLGDGDDRLLLNSHLDVVPPSADHPFDPFDPVEHNGSLYGRGTVDAKASGAAMTAALLTLAREGWTPPAGQALVALTACEETGGGYNGMEDLRPHLPPLSAAIVGEPTSLQPCVAQKGLLILNLHARGRTAHAARAHLGENAIMKAARDLRRLENLRFERADPFLGHPSVTTTTIQGGSARNVVPDRCSFTLDIRTTPAYTHDEITALVAAAVESEVEIQSKRLIPVSTALSERIVQACLQALPRARPFGSPTASDWVFLHDVPTVKLGPGASERSHTPDEHIEVEEVERAVLAYRSILLKYFGA